MWQKLTIIDSGITTTGYKCGVQMNDKHNSKDCLQKITHHKNNTIFVDMKGGKDRCDHVWNL